ncbi:MAG TPA: Clp protease N-terminal domain-containing protein [Acidimicrobiales bacterium]|jgi:ATP-dependent Clp protease ATP-binding subunit ClpC|nr:Clp protease N-terminal domain-containing protein [Acidimicrobiales bacterium]
MTDLTGFGLDARRAIAAAEREARELGHAVVGTEHLLLGLLSDETSSASAALRDAGATLSAARAKVREAVGVRSGVTVEEQSQSASARATRALGRAARFSHSRRAPAVTSEHLLEGVLDVEGTAGQVLRGIGVDVERLRARLAGEPAGAVVHAFAVGSDEPPAESADVASTVAPRCPSCDMPLDEALVWSTLTATSRRGDAVRDAIVFSCAACGETLGVTPA